MSDDAVRAAVENLRKVMMENGYDEGTANALTSGAMPNTPSVVGNLADLQRLGAFIYEGATATEAVNEAVVINPEPGDIPDAPAGTTAGAATNEQIAAADTGTTNAGSTANLNAMTKSQLLDEAELQGVVASDSMTRAEIIAAIEAG